MQTLTEKDLTSGLEDGFTLAALQPAESATPTVGLQVCVVVRTAPDAAAGLFVLIRRTPQARVVLGCTADSAGRPVEWLELWVQSTDYLDGADPAFAATATNAAWDIRWQELSAAMHQGGAGAVLTTPLERGHLLPAALSVGEGRFVALTEGRGGRSLALCIDDDRLLDDAGLPSYATSTHRYLVHARWRSGGNAVRAAAGGCPRKRPDDRSGRDVAPRHRCDHAGAPAGRR